MTEGAVLLLTGPLQSWGGPGAGVYERRTESMPSLSGIIGMISNALGRGRMDPIGDLADGAELAVRADRPGTTAADYHVLGAGPRFALNAEGKRLANPIPTRRWYLQDAAFLAVYTPPANGVSASEVLDALSRPVRPLYLGRRSCPPAERVAVCSTDGRTPEEVLLTARVLREPPGRDLHRLDLSDADYFRAEPPDQISVMIEKSAPEGSEHLASLRPDAPSTFDPRRLAHMHRRVVTEAVQVPTSHCVGRGPAAVSALYESLGVMP